MTSFAHVKNWVTVGILLGVPFVVPELWLVGIVGIALHIYTVYHSKTWRVVLLGSLLAWTIKYLFVLSFYWSMYPMDWLPFDFGQGKLALIFLYWFTVAFFLGCGGVVCGGLAYAWKRIAPISYVASVFVVPLFWLAGEVVGSLVLSVGTFGPGASPNAYFSLGYVGNLLAEHGLLAEGARLAGVYGLSYLAALFAVVLLLVWMRGLAFRVGVIVAALVLVLSAHLVVAEPATPETAHKVALVHTDYPIARLFERSEADTLSTVLEEAVTAAVGSGADYILLPEDTRYFSQREDATFGTKFFSFRYPTSTAVVVDSGRAEDVATNPVLEATIYDAGQKKQYIAHKRYLVPQGEFMPYLYTSLFNVLGFRELTKKVGEVMSYEVGPKTSQADFEKNVPSLLFCFESASGVGVRTLLKERPDTPFVAHIVAHSWFHTPKTFWHQLDTSLRIQAIWNQTYIAVAASYAPSKLVTPAGNIVTPTVVARGEFWEVTEVLVPRR
ncbi:MAG: hypothetical protein AAB388_03235 [Patescibacteria group bacterium]